MDWEHLLSLKRHGDRRKRLRRDQDETRLGFEVDFDRIIFSSAFRSLQDKTQVIPLSKTDFVHTRLTHSLEVSVVGRSLGRITGRKLLEIHPDLKEVHGYGVHDFGAIVAAACLAHDIGNPPFGHSGEKAMGEYFSEGPGSLYRSELKEEEFQDLADFEGNANGFRLLTESRVGVEGGLRLSYATLGAYMKYPRESLPRNPGAHIADKKFGCFQSEKPRFVEIASALGLPARSTDRHLCFARHPLAYLVEAADDICYTIIDFEDGINLGLIPEAYAMEYLLHLVRDSLIDKKYQGMVRTRDRLSYLRALAINTLIEDAARTFIANEEALLRGSFPVSLMDRSRYKAQMDSIIAMSVDKIYHSREVVEKEIAGYKILGDLLEVCTSAFVRESQGRARSFDRLVMRTLPELGFPPRATIYEILLKICGYIAGLSDSRAVHLHGKMSGILR